MNKVFLSHSSQDKAYVSYIAENFGKDQCGDFVGAVLAERLNLLLLRFKEPFMQILVCFQIRIRYSKT